MSARHDRVRTTIIFNATGMSTTRFVTSPSCHITRFVPRNTTDAVLLNGNFGYNQYIKTRTRIQETLVRTLRDKNLFRIWGKRDNYEEAKL
ncbi:hypothetical protein CEXT_598241 [Caerostris extrusa]|uniref:Uncharacterized protein n=1 Tax=Caerostris extrusa TaxID=172846 RepID=A0AAV4Q7C8_CAEEX|nr:hypothetical protein CEXT_598241 [Caerostris extrusa]